MRGRISSLLALAFLGFHPLLSAGPAGLQFDGSTQYVTFGSAPALGAASFTVECWVNPLGPGIRAETGVGGANAVPLVTKGRGEADGGTFDMNYFLGIDPSNSVLVADIEEGTGSGSPGLNHPIYGVTHILPGTWSHVAATFDTSSRRFRLYLNGVLECDSVLGSGVIFPQYLSVQHGGIGTAMNSAAETEGFFDGVIDEVRIWNYARSQQSIADSMTMEINGNAPGLLGRWGLNEGSGTVAANSVSGGVNGTLVASPTWTTGSPFTPPRGLGFGGDAAYVTFGQVPALGLKTFTLECWFKKTGPGATANTGVGGLDAIPLVTKGRGEADAPREVNANYFLGIIGNVLVADFEDSTTGLNHPIIGHIPFTDQLWCHAAATYDGVTWRLYMNGRLDTSLVVGFGPEYSSIQHSALGTGLNSLGQSEGYFQGRLDEVRIWSTARTQAEILSTINAELTAPQSGLLARWSLDERAGSTVHGSAGTANDGVILGRDYGWSDGAPFNIDVNDPPGQPILVAPGQGSTNVAVPPTLSVQVSDPDNTPVTVQFFGRPLATGSFQLLGTHSSVPSGSTAGLVWPGLAHGASYEWYVTVVDTEFTTTGSTWQFTTVLPSYTVTPTAGAGGSITPPGVVTVTQGDSARFDFSPAAGYHIDSVRVDGVSVGTPVHYTFTNIQSNHTIAVTFAINHYTITASAGANGSITPAGAVDVLHGGEQAFAIVPDSGYHVDSVFVDGGFAGAPTSYTFSGVQSDHAIRVSFAINQYTIASSAGPHGSITPSGVVPVNFGTSQSFSIMPDSGYHVDSVFVDGAFIGTVTSHTFTNITASHSIRVVFAINRFTISTAAGTHGMINPAGPINVSYGATPAFTITADTGYHVDSVLVDGGYVGAVTVYSFPPVSANHLLAAVFAINRYTITATAGVHGSIAPGGSVIVTHGNDQTFTFLPDSGYHVDSVRVDGGPVAATPSYTFVNVTDNHSVMVTFAINAYTITSTAGPHGSISPAGAIPVLHGSTQMFSIAADAGYETDSVVVDGLYVGTPPSYTFTGITGDHSIAATFRIPPDTVQLTVNSGWNLLSVPVLVRDFRKAALFPAALTAAYGFSPEGYAARDTLDTGAGYWLKFGDAEVVPLIGAPVLVDTVTVRAGWNLLGSVSVDVPAAGVAALGTGILTPFYRYGPAGYASAGTIVPGQGYWVKVTDAGKLIIAGGTGASPSGVPSGGPSVEGYHALEVEDAAGHVATLYAGTELEGFSEARYQLPPVPPEEAVDVRYTNDAYLAVRNAVSGVRTDHAIRMQGVRCPVTIRWSAAGSGAEGYSLVYRSQGRMQEVILGENFRELTLDREAAQTLVLRIAPLTVPTFYSLAQNFPNPFNPTTTVQFSLPQSGRVVLKLYNVLGQEVRSLLDQEMSAGEQRVRVDASDLASGIYFYRLTAGEFSATRKMLLLQ